MNVTPQGQRPIPTVGDGSGLEPGPRLHPEELGLALRNHALPLEGLRYDVTPTGMHYLLVHYDIPLVDAVAWRLAVGGRVRRPLTLSLDDLHRRPSRTLRVTLECAGDGRALMEPRPISQPWQTGAVGTAEWTGTPLRPLLEEAGLEDDVADLVFTGADHGLEGGVEQDYQRALSRDEALREDVLLAWAMNGAPLEPQHGYPVRLVAPGWYGMAHVKWLRAVDALPNAFAGYQHTAYQYTQSRAEPGRPVELMRVRSLMVPPGFPDFLTRTRMVPRGAVELVGRAWSGRAAVTRVEVSTDGGRTWADAALNEPSGPYAWQGWRHVWDAATPGEHELICRATDSTGEVQPVDQSWNARGMGNNMAHRVRVYVE
jgi:DMSO/TMAO reductase YedYZ molybdopterin-dependent catalytic subunit